MDVAGRPAGRGADIWRPGLAAASQVTMNPRNSWRWLLSAALLLALILIQHRFFRRPFPEPIKILPSLQTASVKSIQILRPSARLEISADRTNSAWLLTKPLTYPGRAPKIDALLTNLSELRPITIITAEELKNRAKVDEEFGFANPQASVLIQQGSDKMQLLIGRITGPGDQIYVQAVGVETIYVVAADLLKWIPSSANEWRDPALLEANNFDCDHICVTNSGKVYVEFNRTDTTSPWRMVRPFASRADSAKIDAYLERLRGMQVSKFVSDDPKSDLEPFGLQRPEIELALANGTNVLAILQFGKTNNYGEFFARHLGQNTIVSVPKDLVTAWRAPVNDFRNQHLFASSQPIQEVAVHADETFSVQRQTNDTWMVMPQGFQADTALVADMLSVLSGMHVEFSRDVVPDSGLPEVGLAPPQRQYRLLSHADSGVSSNSLIVELHFSSRQTNGVFVRRTDEHSIYAISTNDFDRLPVASWQLRDRRLWLFNEDGINGATVKKDKHSIQITRKEKYKWVIAPGSQGLIKNELALEESMRGLIQASALFWVARGEQDLGRFGIKEGSLEITLDLKAGNKVRIVFGGEASPISLYAMTRLSDQPIVFEFPWLLFRDLLTSLPVF
jgi:hypothetical protein